MKRLHIHVAVDQLSESIRFYSALFAAQPSVQHDDYAKWMLDNPRVNFAISQRGRAAGLDHLGIQADTAEELAELEQRMRQAELPHLAQPNSSCCYAESDKHWSMDPSGIAWETFHTLNHIPTYGTDPRANEPTTATTSPSASCCAPPVSSEFAQPIKGKLIAKITGSSCC